MNERHIRHAREEVIVAMLVPPFGMRLVVVLHCTGRGRGTATRGWGL